MGILKTWLWATVLVLTTDLCGAVHISALLDLDNPDMPELLQNRSAELSAEYGVDVTLDLFHINDTLSVINAAQRMSSSTDVIIGTSSSTTTITLVNYLRDAGRSGGVPAIIGFIPATEMLVNERAPGLASAASDVSRAIALGNTGDHYGWRHWTVISESGSSLSTDGLLPPCNATNVKDHCISAVFELKAWESVADAAAYLGPALHASNSTLFLLNVGLVWFFRLHLVLPYDLVQNPQTVWVLSLNTELASQAFTSSGESPWVNQIAAYWEGANAVVLAAEVANWLKVRYGFFDGLYNALALDSLQLAVVGASRVASGEAASFWEGFLNVEFPGYSGIFRMNGMGERVDQPYFMLLINATTRSLTLLAELSGVPGTPINFTTPTQWYPGRTAPSGVESQLPFIIINDGARIGMFMMKAIDMLNADSTVLPDQKFWGQVTTSADMVNHSVFSLGSLGPLTSSQSIIVAPFMYQVYVAPTLSLGTTPDLTHQRHPLFTRIMPSDTLQAEFLFQTIRKFSWTPVCIIQDTSAYGSTLAALLQDNLGADASISTITSYDMSEIQKTLDFVLQQVCRVICTFTMQPAAIRDILWLAHAGNVYEGRNWIFSDSGMYTNFSYPQHLGALWSFPSVTDTIDYSALNVFGAYAYDAVYTYARAVEAMINRRQIIYDGFSLWREMTQLSFRGLTGVVRFNNETGDRLGNYDLVNLVDNGDGASELRVVIRQSDGAETTTAQTRSAQTRGCDASQGLCRATQSSQFELVYPITFAGNTSVFVNRVFYKLLWDETNSTTRFTGENAGTPVQPFPSVRVVQADGNRISFTRTVFVVFDPVPSQFSGTNISSTEDGSATFSSLVVLGERGATHQMTFSTSDGINTLIAVLAIDDCDSNAYVFNVTECRVCVEGAICNGSSILEAEPDYWRTGSYADNGTYYPNLRDQLFLRCPNAACLGGVNSTCRHPNTGIICGECLEGSVYYKELFRCKTCDGSLALHICLLILLEAVYLLILAVVTWIVLKSLGKGVEVAPALVKIFIAYFQTLNLILNVGTFPSSSSSDSWFKLVTAFLSWSGQSVYHFECAFVPNVYTSNFINMFTPIIKGLTFMFVLACVWCVIALARAARHLPAPSWELFLPKRRQVAVFHDQHDDSPADHQGLRPCGNCLRTYAVTYCTDEALALCEPCNKALHPKLNQEKQGHHRVILDPQVGADTRLQFRTVVFIIMFQSYVLTSVRTVVDLMLWWRCTDQFDNGQGAVASYLEWHSEVMCEDQKYLLVVWLNFGAVVCWAILLPFGVFWKLWPYRHRLHEDTTLLRLGWLYQGYHWWAYYWECVLILRKMLFVFVTTVQFIEPRLQYSITLLILMVNISFNYTREPFVWDLANKTDTACLMGCAVSCIIFIMFDSNLDNKDQADLAVLLTNVVGFAAMLRLIVKSRPDWLELLIFSCGGLRNRVKALFLRPSDFELLDFEREKEQEEPPRANTADVDDCTPGSEAVSCLESSGGLEADSMSELDSGNNPTTVVSLSSIAQASGSKSAVSHTVAHMPIVGLEPESPLDPPPTPDCPFDPPSPRSSGPGPARTVVPHSAAGSGWQTGRTAK